MTAVEGKGRRSANGKVWESKKTFTIRVEEMHQVDDDCLSGVAEWRKTQAESPVVWNFIKDEEQREAVQEEEEAEVEDIFRDWLRLQRRGSATSEDVNDVFWKIGMSDSGRTRQRRISEVLENLPFDDQPDIFGDRCELLETASFKAPAAKKIKIGQQRRRLRRQKSYWNIFSDWKKIFNESHGRRQKRKRNFKHRRRSKRHRGGNGDQTDAPRLDVANIDIRNNGFRMRKSPRRRSIVTVENYFRDFLHAFDEDGEGTLNRSRRRSRDMVDDDEFDEVCEENVPKRQRVDKYPSHRRNWEVIRLESSRTFEMITRNIERKIREAFREENEAEAAASDDFGKMRLRQSRQQFDSLRRRVQEVRRERRLRSLEGPDEDAFEEWRWNLDEGVDIPANSKPCNASFKGTAIRGVEQRYHFRGAKGNAGLRQQDAMRILQRLPKSKVTEAARCGRKARFIHNFSLTQPRGRKGDFGARKRA